MSLGFMVVFDLLDCDFLDCNFLDCVGDFGFASFLLDLDKAHIFALLLDFTNLLDCSLKDFAKSYHKNLSS